MTFATTTPACVFACRMQGRLTLTTDTENPVPWPGGSTFHVKHRPLQSNGDIQTVVPVWPQKHELRLSEGVPREAGVSCKYTKHRSLSSQLHLSPFISTPPVQQALRYRFPLHKAQSAPNAIVNRRLPSWSPLRVSTSRKVPRQKDRTWWGTAKPNIGHNRPVHKACEGIPLQAGCAAGRAEQADARDVRPPNCACAPSIA